jgi:hypothetical protein
VTGDVASAVIKIGATMRADADAGHFWRAARG